jgi:hypothetical protein
MGNHFFTILYPGLPPQSTASEQERRDWPSLAIAKDGAFVSLCTKDGCAVFETAQQLRDLRDTLDEAIELFERYQAEPHKE